MSKPSYAKIVSNDDTSYKSSLMKTRDENNEVRKNKMDLKIERLLSMFYCHEFKDFKSQNGTVKFVCDRSMMIYLTLLDTKLESVKIGDSVSIRLYQTQPEILFYVGIQIEGGGGYRASTKISEHLLRHLMLEVFKCRCPLMRLSDPMGGHFIKFEP